MEPFIGQIIMFGGNFAPRNWAFCDGQLIAISSNPALFSLLGTTYGGNGETTFGLPDLRGRVPIHAGQGPGLPNFPLGSKGGEIEHMLVANEIPAHNHLIRASNAEGNTNLPTNAVLAKSGTGRFGQASNPTHDLAANALANTGGNQPHNNLQPYTTVNFIIALTGVFPSES